jgi:hypothetical protein
MSSEMSSAEKCLGPFVFRYKQVLLYYLDETLSAVLASLGVLLPRNEVIQRA